MKIFLRVKANARQEKIEEVSPGHFCAWVRTQAFEGRANQAVIKALSRHFNISPSRISILNGHSSKNKKIALAI
jgi:uncharacterized protein